MKIHPLSVILPLIYPVRYKGYTIDYYSPIDDPCIGCGGKTYRTYENRGIAFCIKCRGLLNVYPDL